MEKSKNSFNVVSLGSSCSISMFLEENGFRSFSGPFDWLITNNFERIVELIFDDFNKFLLFDNLYQSKKYPSHYYDVYNDMYFYHDFNHKSIVKQYDVICKKYKKRIENFYFQIKKPTIFVRKVKKISEIDEYKNAFDEFNYRIKEFNKDNFLVIVDDNFNIIDSKIRLNEFLLNYLSNEYIFENKKFYEKNKKKNLKYRNKNKVINKISRFIPHYKHNKQY